MSTSVLPKMRDLLARLIEWRNSFTRLIKKNSGHRPLALGFSISGNRYTKRARDFQISRPLGNDCGF